MRYDSKAGCLVLSIVTCGIAMNLADYGLSERLWQAAGLRNSKKTPYQSYRSHNGDLYPNGFKCVIGNMTSLSINFPEGIWTGIFIGVKGVFGVDLMAADLLIG